MLTSRSEDGFVPVMPSHWRVSWAGLEAEREAVRVAARKVAAADARVRGSHPSSVATGLICEAVRDHHLAATPDVADAGQAVSELFRLHRSLVWAKHIDFDVVRREWATILNPCPGERERCDALVAAAVRREAKKRKRGRPSESTARKRLAKRQRLNG